MNVLLITEFYSESKSALVTGGVELRTRFNAEYLRKQGHKVQVVSRKPEQVAVSFWSIPARIWFIFEAIWKARNASPDLVEGSNWLTHIPAFVIAKLKNAAAVGWFADVYKKTWFENFGLLSATAGYVLEEIALRLPWDKVISLSKSTEQKLLDAGVSKDKIELVYGGVEVMKFKKVKKFGRPTICALARLVSYKRIQDLIIAFGIVRKKIPDVQLVIAGDGPYRGELEKLVKEKKMENKVKFMGTLSHAMAMKLLRKSHVFCLPSLVEGFGLVTVESMASGVPYVNSDIAPTREITDGGVGGILFEPKNEKELAKKIEKLLSDKRLYKKKVDEGRKFVRKYDWGRITRQTANVYKGAALVH